MGIVQLVRLIVLPVGINTIILIMPVNKIVLLDIIKIQQAMYANYVILIITVKPVIQT